MKGNIMNHLKENMFPCRSVAPSSSATLPVSDIISTSVPWKVMESPPSGSSQTTPQSLPGILRWWKPVPWSFHYIRIQLHLHEVEPPFSICCLHDVGCRQLHRWSRRFRGDPATIFRASNTFCRSSAEIDPRNSLISSSVAPNSARHWVWQSWLGELHSWDGRIGRDVLQVFAGDLRSESPS